MKFSRATYLLAMFMLLLSCSITEEEYYITGSSELAAIQDKNFVALLKNAIELRDEVLAAYVAPETRNVVAGNEKTPSGCYMAHADATALLNYIEKTPRLNGVLAEALKSLALLLNEKEVKRNFEDGFDVLDKLYPMIKKSDVYVRVFSETTNKNPDQQPNCLEILDNVNNDIAHIVTEIVTVDNGPAPTDTKVFEEM